MEGLEQLLLSEEVLLLQNLIKDLEKLPKPKHKKDLL